MPDPPPDDDSDPARDDDDDGALSPRAKRRPVTPLTGGLAAVLVAAGGFIAGVQVQKGQQDTGSGTGAGLRAAGVAGARGGGAAAGGADAPTFGTVSSKKGATLYVRSADGTTVAVKTNAQSKVTRNAAASARGIYPGDTVVVQATKDESGDLVATQVTATSKSAAAAGGGFGGGGLRAAFGGGAGPPGAAPPGG